MNANAEIKRPVTIWLWSGIVLILMMVVIGGLTRLTHSGLSMVHWTITGSLPPLHEAEWVAEFQRYQTSPEYKELHSHFSIDDFKSIYWWEYIHRMFGRMLGVVFIIPFAFFWWKKWIPRKMLPQFFIILGLGAFQALLGWFMVKSGLVDVPRVSHYRLAAHLTTAFLTCSYILWVLLDYQSFGRKAKVVSSQRPLVWTALMLLIIQIVYGAFVAGLKAGWVHNTWPLMDANLISDAVWAMDPIIMNFLEGKSGVQFVHRTLAIIVFAFIYWLAFAKLKSAAGWLKKPAQLLACAVTIQFILGVLTLLLAVPIVLGVLHQVVALIVLLSAVWLLHRSTFEWR